MSPALFFKMPSAMWLRQEFPVERIRTVGLGFINRILGRCRRATSLLLCAAASHDSHGRSCYWCEHVEPKSAEMTRHEGGCERAGGIHRGAANRTGKHRFQADH